MKHSKTNKTPKHDNLIFFSFISIALGICGLCAFEIVKYYHDSSRTSTQIKVTTDLAEPEDMEGPESSVSDLPPFLDVQLNNLKAHNSDTVAWIEVKGTNIDYPVVKSSDNLFYLSHSFDKTESPSGWVFLDYRNSSDLTDQNNTLYAHGRLDGTMFGSLRNLFLDEWYSNPDNYYIRTKTERSSAIWKIFSVYTSPVTSDYLQMSFTNDSFMTFLENVASRSELNFNTNLDDIKRILTLSTCYDNNSRIVVHAQLIAESYS